MMTRRLAAFFVWFFILSIIYSCEKSAFNEQAEERNFVRQSHAGPIMGTSYNVIYYINSTNNFDKNQLESDISASLNSIVNVMSSYEVSSEISQLNRSIQKANFSEGSQRFEVSENLASVIQQSQLIALSSSGYFDITVAPLVNLWGFGAKEDANDDLGTIRDEVKRLKQQVGYQYLDIIDQTLVVSKAVEIDVAAIAKGWAVDEISELLVAKDIDRFMVEIGGEIRTGRSKPDGPWRLAIERPTANSFDARSPQQILELDQLSIATSGDYRNYRIIDGQRYSHTIDPTTGFPVTHQVASVTVLHKEAAMADGWATALNAMGAKKGVKLANELGLAAKFLIYQDDDFKEVSSDAFLAKTQHSGDN